MRGGIRAQREVPRVHRRINQPGGRIERGMDIAATRPPAARAATETFAAILVLHAVRRHAGAIRRQRAAHRRETLAERHFGSRQLDRKSTRLNSSHTVISYAVFCLKKKTTRSAMRRCQYRVKAKNRR